MDHPVDLTAIFGFDWNTITVSSHGDDRILQIGAQRTIHQIGKGGMDFIIDLSDAAADILQGTAGIITDFIFSLNTAFNFGGQRKQRFQLFKIRIQTVSKLFLGIVSAVGFDFPRVLKNLTDTEELSASKAPPISNRFKDSPIGNALPKEIRPFLTILVNAASVCPARC